MFNLFKKTEYSIIKLEEVYFDESNREEFVQKYFKQRVPVLIKGGAKHWPLMKRWNKNYVVQKAGNYFCTVVSDSRPAAAREQATLKEYFQKHPGKSTLTLQRFDESSFLPLLKDLPIPSPFFSKETIKRYFFYHSVKDAGTLPHRHRHAFNILVNGSKHWVFHDASERTAKKGFAKMNEFMLKYPSGSTAKRWFMNELKDLPAALKKIKVYECIQEAGDIVYIPNDFSHTVLNLSEVMGVVIECDEMNNMP